MKRRTIKQQLKLAEDLLSRIQHNVGTLASQRIVIRGYFGENERGELIHRSDWRSTVVLTQTEQALIREWRLLSERDQVTVCLLASLLSKNNIGKS